MIFVPISLHAGRARSSRFFTLSLLVALASPASALSVPQRIFHPPAPSRTRVQTARAAVPYLTKFGATPLRFAPPPPEPVERPLPPDPVQPAVSAAIPLLPATPSPTDATTPNPAEKPAESAGNLMRIIPDDTPHDVKAEDVMSYFQLPRQATPPAPSGESLPFAPAQPAGSTLPPSSATYEQK